MKHKTQLQWFKEGDTNSKYFHSFIRLRRRRLFVHQILTGNADWIQGDDNIAQVSYDHFNDIFTVDEKLITEKILTCIPRIVSQYQNNQFTSNHNMNELKEVVFYMNPNSATGLDGMNRYFFQKCMQIIKKYLMRVVKDFLSGQMIPKYFSHSCIVLLSKVSNPNKLIDFRPISLSNFTSKFISKLMSNRVSHILPSLISINQSGFN